MSMLLFTEEIFVLVSWPEEEHDVSVISSVHHSIQGAAVVGEICSVAFGKRTFPALVHATGKACCVACDIVHRGLWHWKAFIV